MKECPVCKRPDLADGLARCPQCNADLECFDLLDALQEKPADQAPVPLKPTADGEWPDETGSRSGELRGRWGPSGRGTRKMGLAAGLALLLVLVPFTTLVGNRYLIERIDRLESHLAPAGNRTGPFPPEWSQLYGAVQNLNTRMEGVVQQLSGLTTQQAKIAAETRGERSKLEGGLIAMGERMSRVEAQLAALGRRQEVGRKELKQTMAELAASFPPAVGLGGSTLQPGVQPSPGGPSVTATPARAPTFTDYHAAPGETLWRIAWRFYGKGIYYPVLLEDNPGLAVHGPLDGRTLRIARQREQAQETYRRLVYSDGGRTLFRYRAQADDSWRSLARAFYGSERRARELAELNGTQHPETDRRVLIPLD
ncbi:MAG: LysM peptidoglycan-binding domain-containing protein [Gammaproteobacteria bacterium]|nr:LysM peptidoglycan-binding domain-containing protein [Gammaproteobacteria bacterium]